MEFYMFNKVLISSISFVLASQVSAQSYQFEGSVNYTKEKAAKDYAADGDRASAYGSYYFSPVVTDNLPLQEAAFLGKNSSVSLTYTNGKSSEDDVFDDGTVRAEYGTESKSSAFILAADTYLFDGLVYVGGIAFQFKSKDTTTTKVSSNIFSSLNYTETTKEKDTDDDWHINLGVAPIKGLLIWSEFMKDIDVGNSWNLNAKYIMELNSGTLNVQGGFGKNAFAFLATPLTINTNNAKLNFAGFEDAKLNSVYLTGDYYFTNTLSVGLGVSDYASDNGFVDPDNSYLIRSKYFFTETFSIQAEYMQADLEDTFSIGASMRF
jgi:hypothetical protein